MSLIDTIWIFIKGFLMGLADVVPGVSGGTIALITGIYKKLIFSISEINATFIFDFLKKDYKNMKKNIFRINFSFFIPLALGIGLAIILLSKIISSLLENYTSYTYAFFFGLILASVYFVQRKVKKFSYHYIISLCIGLIFSFWIIGLGVMEKIGHSYFIIFFSGAIAICAMILPGISGAFILLFLGQYEYMLNVLHNFEILKIFTFLFGAGVGILSFSHLLNYLLDKHKGLTLSFLTGLMLGALRLPYNEINANGVNLPLEIIIGIFGFLMVIILEVIFIKKNKK